MNDVLPDAGALWSAVESEAQAVFDAYGYRRIRVPVMERTELFSRSIGETTDIVQKEMYTFTDRSGDSVTLRPEATASVVRAGLSHGLFHNQLQKLWCSGPMFRHERPQKARYRQFHQIDLEAIGFAGPEVDAEIIVMSARIWERLGLESPRLELNSLGTPDCRAGYRKALREYFSAAGDVLDADSLERLRRNPLRILDSKDPLLGELIAGAPVLSGYLDDDSAAHFKRLKELLDDAGVEYRINPRLVRGLDYYTRTVFEWVTDRLGAQGAICSGGRYDGLVAQLGGRDTPAIGWAMGLERVVELMVEEGRRQTRSPPHGYLVIAGDEARRRGLGIAETLRAQAPGIRITMDCAGGSFRSQMKRADRSGALLALILGDDELANSALTIKPLREVSPQKTCDLGKVVTELLRVQDDSP
ncbi:MAG: histidine--tRNA ligase [Rhodospirillaceae bacterium]|nr:histidine--tRNA ligase [Rhodospirillaceae bacterium]